MRLLLASWLCIERISACQSGCCSELCSSASTFTTVLDFPDSVCSLSRRRTWHLQTCAAGYCLLMLVVVRKHCSLDSVWSRYCRVLRDCGAAFCVIEEVLDGKDCDLRWGRCRLRVRVVTGSAIQVDLLNLFVVLLGRWGDHFLIWLLLLRHSSMLLVSRQASALHWTEVVASTLMRAIYLTLIW